MMEDIRKSLSIAYTSLMLQSKVENSTNDVRKYHTEQEAETSIEHRFQLINTPVNIAV
jgi:hypothetical protein